jgi:hypothetical protein
MQDFVCQCTLQAKRCADLKVEIPPPVAGLMLLQGAGLSEEQVATIHGALGLKGFALANVRDVLLRVLGHLSNKIGSFIAGGEPPPRNPRNPRNPTRTNPQQPQGALPLDAKGRPPKNGKHFLCKHCVTDAHSYWTEDSGFCKPMMKARAARGLTDPPPTPKWHRDKLKASAVGLTLDGDASEEAILPMLTFFAGAPSDSRPRGPSSYQAPRKRPSVLSFYANSHQRSRASKTSRTQATPSCLDRLTDECHKHSALVVDPGCAVNVAGSEWASKASKYLGPFRTHHESRNFKFGAGQSVWSTKCVLVPSVVGGVNVWFKFFIIPGSLPPLLSKGTMKKLSMVLDMGNDRASGVVRYKDEHKVEHVSPFALPLIDSPTGHYLISFPKMPIH